MSTKKAFIAFNFLILSVMSFTTSANIKLPAIFSNNMVLQRDQNIPVWGRAAPGEVVTVTFDKQTVKTTADETGKWEVKLAPLKLGEPRFLVVSGKNTITFKNILVGDVWLCSGQSNMEMGIKAANNAKKEIENAKYPDIRLFVVPKAMGKCRNRL